MGLLDFLKKAAAPARPEPVDAGWAPGIVCAPVSGRTTQLSETSDPVFASGCMGGASPWSLPARLPTRL